MSGEQGWLSAAVGFVHFLIFLTAKVQLKGRRRIDLWLYIVTHTSVLGAQVNGGGLSSEKVRSYKMSHPPAL